MDVQKFGRFIAQKRKEKKMTQMQMGEQLGVTGKTVSRWENGNYMPDIALLIPIADLLDVTVNELLNGECKLGVILLMHTMLFQQLGISGNILKEHFGITNGGVAMSEEMLKVVVVIFMVMLLGIGLIVFSFWFLWENRKRNRLQGLTEGKVIGILKSGLFKNKTYGEFPGGVLMGWGVGRGEQYWGGTLKMDVPPWFPCVKFEVDGKEYHVITGCGTFKGKWQLNQNVTVLYNPENQRIAYLEGDDSYVIHHRIYFCLGIFLVLLSALAYVILVL